MTASRFTSWQAIASSTTFATELALTLAPAKSSKVGTREGEIAIAGLSRAFILWCGTTSALEDHAGMIPMTTLIPALHSNLQFVRAERAFLPSSLRAQDLTLLPVMARTSLRNEQQVTRGLPRDCLHPIHPAPQRRSLGEWNLCLNLRCKLDFFDDALCARRFAFAATRKSDGCPICPFQSFQFAPPAFGFFSRDLGLHVPCF